MHHTHCSMCASLIRSYLPHPHPRKSHIQFLSSTPVYISNINGNVKGGQWQLTGTNSIYRMNKVRCSQLLNFCFSDSQLIV